MGKKKNITAFSDQSEFDVFLSAILAEPKPDFHQAYKFVRQGYEALISERKELRKKLETIRQEEPHAEVSDQAGAKLTLETSRALTEKLLGLIEELGELEFQFSNLEYRRALRFVPAIQALKGTPNIGALELLSAASYVYDITPRDTERTDLVRVIAETSAPSAVLLVNPPVDAAIRFADHNTDRLISYYSEDESFAEITQLIGVNNSSSKVRAHLSTQIRRSTLRLRSDFSRGRKGRKGVS